MLIRKIITKILKKVIILGLGFKENNFHPLVWIHGDPIIGKNVYIGAFSLVNANKSSITIGDGCDIASFVAINGADSHRKCIGLVESIQRSTITIEHNTFIGSHTVVKGNTFIGHHSVIAAGTIIGNIEIPPYSLVSGNPIIVKPYYYKSANNSS